MVILASDWLYFQRHGIYDCILIQLARSTSKCATILINFGKFLEFYNYFFYCNTSNIPIVFLMNLSNNSYMFMFKIVMLSCGAASKVPAIKTSFVRHKLSLRSRVTRGSSTQM